MTAVVLVTDVFVHQVDVPRADSQIQFVTWVLNTCARKRIELRTLGGGDVVHKYVDRKYRWFHQNIDATPFVEAELRP